MARRTILVTGSARGIGKATHARIAAEGHLPIGLDLDDADICADLATPAGRAAALLEVSRKCGGILDGVVACAGLATADAAAMVGVNYFGTVALLEGLQPLLAAADQPRAVAVSSSSIMLGHDEALVEACLAADEVRAKQIANATPTTVYSSTKLALSRWIKLTAVLPQWAGSGILLNAAAPGTVLTRITRPILASEEGRAMLAEATPIAVGAYAEPEDVAPLLTFLASADCRYIVGQTIFIDGGNDAIRRGDRLP